MRRRSLTWLLLWSASAGAGVHGPPLWTAAPVPDDRGFGDGVQVLGDVNGDGFGDVGVHVPDPLGEPALYIWFGGLDGPSLTADQVIPGPHGVGWGTQIAPAGDQDGDGRDDVWISSPGQNAGAGSVVLWLGAAHGLVASGWEAHGSDPGFAVGAALATGCDIDADGHDDLISGTSWFGTPWPSGRIHVWFGGLGGPIDGPPHQTVESFAGDPTFGHTVACAGDTNGDGHDEVLVGASFLGPGGGAHVFLGTVAGLSPLPTWSATPPHAAVDFGATLAGLGDVNGDGYADVVVGGPSLVRGGDELGGIWLFPGSPSGPTDTPMWSLRGDVDGSRMGTALAGGDLGGDGFADLVVSAPGWTHLVDGEGAVFVFEGGRGGLPDDPTWMSFGGTEDAHLGSGGVSLGDVTGDGLPELLIGSPDEHDTHAGTARMFAGADRNTPTMQLHAPELWEGQPAQLTVEHARPEDRVFLVRGTVQGDGPCPRPLRGVCLDLLGGVILGDAIADEHGTAILDLPGQSVGDIVLQAVTNDGRDSRKTHTVATPVYGLP